MDLKFRNLVIRGIQNPKAAFQIIFHLPQFVKLYYRLFRDPRVPLHLKIVLVAALLYVISPIDLIPDWLFPILGEIDDIIVLVAALRYFLNKCPREILMEHVQTIEAGQ